LIHSPLLRLQRDDLELLSLDEVPELDLDDSIQNLVAVVHSVRHILDRAALEAVRITVDNHVLNIFLILGQVFTIEERIADLRAKNTNSFNHFLNSKNVVDPAKLSIFDLRSILTVQRQNVAIIVRAIVCTQRVKFFTLINSRSMLRTEVQSSFNNRISRYDDVILLTAEGTVTSINEVTNEQSSEIIHDRYGNLLLRIRLIDIIGVDIRTAETRAGDTLLIFENDIVNSTNTSSHITEVEAVLTEVDKLLNSTLYNVRIVSIEDSINAVVVQIIDAVIERTIKRLLNLNRPSSRRNWTVAKLTIRTISKLNTIQRTKVRRGANRYIVVVLSIEVRTKEAVCICIFIV